MFGCFFFISWRGWGRRWARRDPRPRRKSRWGSCPRKASAVELCPSRPRRPRCRSRSPLPARWGPHSARRPDGGNSWTHTHRQVFVSTRDVDDLGRLRTFKLSMRNSEHILYLCNCDQSHAWSEWFVIQQGCRVKAAQLMRCWRFEWISMLPSAFYPTKSTWFLHVLPWF